MNNSIYLKDINKKFKNKHVVKNLTLAIPKGKITGFLGPNGSGKTTSMKIMSGLLSPDSGQGKCFGYDILSQRNEIKHLIGYMSQYFSLWKNMTVQENLRFLASVHRIENPRHRVGEVIELFGLDTYRNHLTRELSGGWCQRTSLAACVLHNPKLILLDEPTAGVDPAARRDFWKILHALSNDGMTILVSTHYMDEAERCQHLACMSSGVLLASGNVEEIIASQKLITFSIKGRKLAHLEYELTAYDAVKQTTLFGNTLFVTGSFAEPLAAIVNSLPSEYAVQRVATTLEDSFTHLMNVGKP